MRVRFITALALILIIGMVNAFSDRELADMYYQQALDEYNKTNCKNASQLAGFALNYYDKAHNTGSKDKVTALIIDINTCLKNQAYGYYYQALDYYNQGRYTDAADFVSRSKELYSIIPYQDGMDRCDGLIAKIDKKVSEDKGAHADSLYHQAEELFISERYILAKGYIQNASAIYTEIGNSAGIERCRQFLITIGGKITDIRERANINYGMAQDYYEKGGYKNYDTAIEYAGEAKRLYLWIDDQEGAVKAQELMDVLFGGMSAYETEQNKKAEKYYSEARTDYLLEDYEIANSTLIKAYNIYRRFFDIARSADDRTMMANYSKKIKKVTKLQNRINEELIKARIRADAEDLYGKAYVFFGSGCFRNASEKVEKAYELFESIDYPTGMSKCIVLRIKINESQRNLGDATLEYMSAKGYYQSADYEAAMAHIRNGSNILLKMECDEKSRCCYSEYKKLQDLNLSIQTGIAKKEKADNYYAEAERYFGLSNYEMSRDYSIRANDIYKEINYSIGISQSEDMISSNEDMLGAAEKQSNIFSIGVVLVVTIMVIFVILKWRSEREEREMEERHRIGEEIQRKERKKKLFDEKRRALEDMVERERTIMKKIQSAGKKTITQEDDAIKKVGKSTGGERTIEKADVSQSMEEDVRKAIQEAKREIKEVPEEE